MDHAELMHREVLCEHLLIHELTDVHEAVESRCNEPYPVHGPEGQKEPGIVGNEGCVGADLVPFQVHGDVHTQCPVCRIRKRHLVTEVRGVLVHSVALLGHLHHEVLLVAIVRPERVNLQSEVRAPEGLGQDLIDCLAVGHVRHALREFCLELPLREEVRLAGIPESLLRLLEAPHLPVPVHVHCARPAHVPVVSDFTAQREDQDVLALVGLKGLVLLDGRVPEADAPALVVEESNECCQHDAHHNEGQDLCNHAHNVALFDAHALGHGRDVEARRREPVNMQKRWRLNHDPLPLLLPCHCLGRCLR
mmetsp:Transcript_56173/g.130812  ORF Transcript_56173/g.130812 Transcript_56173/m.130812 type:complete len:307 (+) Transcript_56173:1521-2441(+)